MSYAKNTSVPVDRSRAEIEKLLKAHGATAFAYAEDRGRFRLAFRIAERSVQMELPMPTMREFARTPTGKTRTSSGVSEHFNREVRRRWRALLLVIKAKLEAVATGISTIEREFLADVLLPDGRTFGAWYEGQCSALDVGEMPPLLGGPQGPLRGAVQVLPRESPDAQ